MAGVAPIKVPASLRESLGKDYLTAVDYGEYGAAIGVVEAKTAGGFSVTNAPLESAVWLQGGGIMVCVCVCVCVCMCMCVYVCMCV